MFVATMTICRGKWFFYLFLLSVPRTFVHYCLVSNLKDKSYLAAIMAIIGCSGALITIVTTVFTYLYPMTSC